MNDKGVLYIATREKYLKEAEKSAESLKKHNPDLPITLETCEKLTPTNGVFDSVIIRDDYRKDFEDSLLEYRHCLYDKTLFLDSDTYICDDVTDIFEMLDTYDIVGCYDPTRNGNVNHRHKSNVPESFPQINTGVLAFNDNHSVYSLFESWRNTQDEIRDKIQANLNQPAFRIAVYNWDNSIGILPPEYNIRLGNVTGNLCFASGKIKIIHGRSALWNIEDMAEYININDEERVIINENFPPDIITRSDRANVLSLADQLHWYMYKNGIKEGIKLPFSLIKEKIV